MRALTVVMSSVLAGQANTGPVEVEPVESSLANLLLAFGAPAQRQLHGHGLKQNARRVRSAPLMFKFLKEAFPDLQKPDWLPDFGGSKVEEEEIEIEVQAPSEALVTAGKGMSALSGVFGVEADLQALALNLGSYDEEEVREEIEATIQEAPVVVYTYGLSPFSTEALAILESTGCEVKNVELGGEWFLLGPKASATRVELRKMYGQGSLPHIFIGGEWIGGLATGGDGGLVGLVEREELVPKLRAAGAL